jgi:hypothetical protein
MLLLPLAGNLGGQIGHHLADPDPSEREQTDVQDAVQDSGHSQSERFVSSLRHEGLHSNFMCVFLGASIASVSAMNLRGDRQSPVDMGALDPN